MPTPTANQQAALASGRFVRRDFLYVEARDPDTGDPDPQGLWNGVNVVEIGGKTYTGIGGRGNIESNAVSNMSIPSLTLQLDGISEDVIALVRGKALSQAPVTHSIGIFDPDTLELIDGELIQMFVGYVDDIEIPTPEKGQTTSIILTCESASLALTIRFTGVRSDATQKLRNSDDRFYEYTPTQKETRIYFGRREPRSHRGGGRKTTRFKGDGGLF